MLVLAAVTATYPQQSCHRHCHCHCLCYCRQLPLHLLICSTSALVVAPFKQPQLLGPDQTRPGQASSVSGSDFCCMRISTPSFACVLWLNSRWTHPTRERPLLICSTFWANRLLISSRTTATTSTTTTTTTARETFAFHWRPRKGSPRGLLKGKMWKVCRSLCLFSAYFWIPLQRVLCDAQKGIASNLSFS